MRKHPKFDKLDSYDRQIWLRITAKKPAGWRVTSVNMKGLRRIRSISGGQTWDLIRDETTQSELAAYFEGESKRGDSC